MNRLFFDLTAADLMQREVYFYRRGVTARELASTMVEERFGSVPIVDEENRPIGTVSEGDLLGVLQEGNDLENVTTEEVMASPALCVTEETKADEILRLLQEKPLIRLPVTDRHGELVGIVTRLDVLSAYLNVSDAPLNVSDEAVMLS